MGLEVRRSIAASDAVGLEPEVNQNLLGEPCRLVRNHSPAHVARGELAEQLVDAGKKPRLTAAARSAAVSASVPSKSKSTAQLGIARAAHQVVHVAVGAQAVAPGERVV